MSADKQFRTHGPHTRTSSDDESAKPLPVPYIILRWCLVAVVILALAAIIGT